MGALFDLSSVQQIAGPQGTLYGGSAAGGAINRLSMKQSADFSGDLLLDGGNYDQVRMAANQNLRARDQISFRVSADYNRNAAYKSQGLEASNRTEGRRTPIFTQGSDLLELLWVRGDNGQDAKQDQRGR